MITYLAILSRCFLIRGTMLDSFVFSLKSFRHLTCVRYFCSYAFCENATATCSLVTHSSRLFLIWAQNPSSMKGKPNMKTYNSQYKGNGRQWEHFVLEKLRVDHTIILFTSEPGLVDEHLDDRCEKYPCFLLCVLLQHGIIRNLKQKNLKVVHMPYKYIELHQGAA